MAHDPLAQFRFDILSDAFEDFQNGTLSLAEWQHICKLWLGREPEALQPQINIGWLRKEQQN